MVQKSADYFLFLLFISVRYFFSVYWALSLCQMLQQEQQGCGVLETSAVWWTRIKELRRKGRHRNKKGNDVIHYATYCGLCGLDYQQSP